MSGEQGRTAVVNVLGGAWLGASLITAAVVAPAAFEQLPSRTLAGNLVGAVLPTVFVSGIIIAGVVLLLGLAGKKPNGGHRWRSVAAFAWAAACIIAQFVVNARVARIRASLPGPIETLSPTDPLRLEFGRMHGLSVGLLGVAMLAAVVVVLLTSLSRPTANAG